MCCILHACQSKQGFGLSKYRPKSMRNGPGGRSRGPLEECFFYVFSGWRFGRLRGPLTGILGGPKRGQKLKKRWTIYVHFSIGPRKSFFIDFGRCGDPKRGQNRYRNIRKWSRCQKQCFFEKPWFSLALLANLRGRRVKKS
jgi:hypothetical protein